MFTSAKDLIAKKAVIGERKDARLDVEIEGLGVWRFRVPNVEEVVDAQTYGTKHTAADDSGDTFLVYNQCEFPDLHDAELQSAYGVSGCKVVHKLLRPGEVEELAKALMAKAGYRGGTVEIVMQGAEDLKNA